MNANPKTIIFYGTTWCYTSRRARTLLDNNAISYTFVDIDQDMDGRRYVEEVNKGYRSVPTILFPDGSLMVEPTVQELKDKLGLV